MGMNAMKKISERARVIPALRQRQLRQNRCPVFYNLNCDRTLTIATGLESCPKSRINIPRCTIQKVPSKACSLMVDAGTRSATLFSTSTVANASAANDIVDAKDKGTAKDAGSGTSASAGKMSMESNSVSSEEVSKFSSMASTWWQVDHNPLISMNPVRMSFITDQISKHRSSLKGDQLTSSRKSNEATIRGSHPYLPLKGLKALDVGCGGGLLSESLARLGANVTAIDPSCEVAHAAQIHSQKSKDKLVRGIQYRGGMSVEDLAKEYSDMDGDGSLFDIVCVLEVIEHTTDPRSLIEAATSLLKKPKYDDANSADGELTLSPSPGGMLFVSTINRTAKSFGIAIVGGEYVTGKLPIGTHTWNQFLSPQEVNKLVNEFRVEEVEKKGMILRPPFYDLRWYLDDENCDVNWIGAYSHVQRSS